MSHLELLPEDESERKSYDSSVEKLFYGNSLLCVSTTLAIWSKQYPSDGTLSKLLAIMSNEVLIASLDK